MNAITLANINLMLNYQAPKQKPSQSTTKYSLEYPDLTNKSVARYKLLTKPQYTSQELAEVFKDQKQEAQNVIRSLLNKGYVIFKGEKRFMGGIYKVIRK